MEWIDALDSELSLLREAEARIYYEADLGEPLDTAHLKRISQQRRDLLICPDIITKATKLSAQGADPVVRRKAQLLRTKATMVRIDDSPELLAIRHELEQTQQDCKDQLRHPAGMRAYLKATEQACKARITTANEIARREGSSNYPEAKLASQELSICGLGSTLGRVRAAYATDCASVVSPDEVAGLTQVQLDGTITERLAYKDEQFPADRVVDTATRTLAAFGLDLQTLPIKIETCKLPYPGAVHTLKIGQDIRVVMNVAKDGFRRYATFFHELGHALYYAYVPDSDLLLDDRIAREGLAELWTGLIERPEWLRRFGGLSQGDADELTRRRRLFHAYMVMTFVRETFFELALYENPAADFAELWGSVTEDCFGAPDRTGVYSEFVFLYPMDIKDYIYADLISSGIIEDLAGRFGDDLLSAQVFQFVTQQYCEGGNLRPWAQRFPGFDAGGSFVG